MKTKKEILNIVGRYPFPAIVSYSDFFEGNNYAGTIGVNIFPNPIKPSEFYEVFKRLMTSGRVSEIVVPISDADDPPEWFYADSIYIVGEITLEELKKETEVLKPSEIHPYLLYGKPTNCSLNIEGNKCYTLWWD